MSPSKKFDNSSDNGTENHVIKLEHLRIEIAPNKQRKDNCTIAKGLLSTCEILVDSRSPDEYSSSDHSCNEILPSSPMNVSNNNEHKQLLSPTALAFDKESGIEWSTVHEIEKRSKQKKRFFSLEIFKQHCNASETQPSSPTKQKIGLLTL